MFDILLEAALRATLIAGAALAALWSLRVRAPAVRHRVWTVTVLAMLVLPVAIAFAPDVSLTVLPPAYPQDLSPPAVDMVATAAAVETATSEATELTSAPAWSLSALLLTVYFVGAAVLVARLAIGMLRVHRLARDATDVNGLLTSKRIVTPFTFGLIRPALLLPAGWDRWPAARLAMVLDHERAHIARRDPLVQWLALLNRAVFWFHPLAWWLERHLARLAEEACDATVLARGHSAEDYSQQLLHVARALRGRRPAHLIGMAMPGSALPERIAKILDGGIGSPGSRRAAFVAGTLATLAAAALGTVTLAQEAGGPRNLFEIYERALVNDATVQQSEAEYRTLAAARPRVQSDIDRALADNDAARQALLIRVAEPYFRAIAAERVLALNESERDTASRQLEQAMRRFEVGLIPITDVQESQARFDQTVANALTTQSELAAARQALHDVVGEPVGELEPLAAELPLSPPEPSSAEQWVETALQRNPTLVSRRIRAETADDDAARRSARADLERVAVQTEQATRAAYGGVVSEIARVRALEQSLRSNRVALQATQAAFETGTRSSADVVMAESNVRQSESVYALSRTGYALNVLRLQQAAGTLTAQEIARTNDWFE